MQARCNLADQRCRICQVTAATGFQESVDGLLDARQIDQRFAIQRLHAIRQITWRRRFIGQFGVTVRRLELPEQRVFEAAFDAQDRLRQCQPLRQLGLAAEGFQRLRLIDDGLSQNAQAERTEHIRSEEHTSELQSLMRISYAVFCLKKKKTNKKRNIQTKYPLT